jgi:hypothetical protein
MFQFDASAANKLFRFIQRNLIAAAHLVAGLAGDLPIDLDRTGHNSAFCFLARGAQTSLHQRLVQA